jgi:hypothetical protein
LPVARVPEDVIYLEPTEPPVANLPTYFDGLKSTGTTSQGNACSYMCRTLHPTQEHCKQKHNWTNQQRRRGDARLKQLAMTVTLIEFPPVLLLSLPESHVKTVRPPSSSVFTTCSFVSLMISSTHSRALCIHVSASRDSATLYNAWTSLHNTIDQAENLIPSTTCPWLR